MVTIQEAQNSPQLFDKFIHENEGLVWSILRKHYAFSFGSDESQDYFQEGCIGLIKAVKKFKPEMNTAFSTYAVPMIWGAMARYCRDYGTTMLSVPRVSQSLHFKISSLKGQDMTDEEIRSTLNISEETYNSSVHSLNCDSLNKQIGDDDSRSITLEDTLSSDIDIAEQVTEKEYLRDKLSKLKESLTERQYNTFVYYLNGMSQAEIGKRIGVSQAEVSRTIRKVIQKCKEVGEERKVVEMKNKITLAQLIDECKVHGTDRKAATVIAEVYGMANSSVYALIGKNKVRHLLESAKSSEVNSSMPGVEIIEEKAAASEKLSASLLKSLLKIDVMAGKEFKYELGEGLKIIKGDDKLSCEDLSRLIQELQEIQRMQQVG